MDAALAQAQADVAALRDREQEALAWHNVGVVLSRQGRAAEAIVAFDQARSFDTLPRRLLWYRHDMYAAYFEAGRYQDVIDLADLMLQSPGLEESFYWRARARDSLGERTAAVEDLRAALGEHPGWAPALEQLAAWGVAP
jgi:tetratricopeptide (TPR) repeat protein